MRNLSFLLLIGLTGLSAQSITKVDFEVLPGNLIDVTYTIYDTEPGAVYIIELYASLDGGYTYPIHANSVTGDVGQRVMGAGLKSILWKVLEDVPALVSDNLALKVVGRTRTTVGGFFRSLVVGNRFTKAAFNRIFEGQLQNYIKPGESDVFVYYSGHGAPDVESASGYFVPHDADPSYAAQTGYSLEQFYRQLGALEARSVTVVVDACFSGGSEAGMLIQAASPIFISVENPVANLKNGVVLTSSSGDQISSWHKEVGHGLFTYYFLKGIRGEADGDQDGKVTSTEVFGYILEHVPYLARRLYNREQTPQLMGESLDQVLVAY